METVDQTNTDVDILKNHLVGEYDAFENATDACPAFGSIQENGEQVRSQINETLPTLALMTFTIGGDTGLHMSHAVAQQAGVNIIGLTQKSVAHMRIKNGNLYTNHGYTIGLGGNVTYGIFDEPIQIHALEEASLNDESRVLLQQSSCEVYTNGPIYTALRSKKTAKDLLSTVTDFAPGIYLDRDAESVAAFDAFLQKSALVSSTVVIKPERGIQGYDVQFFDINDQPAIQASIHALYQKGCNVLAETYIQPLPIVGEDGNAIETNIRAVSVGSMAVESLGKLLVVRAGEKGKPTNVATGAKMMPISWLLEQAARADIDPDHILKQILASQGGIRDTGVRTFGSDYIVDATGKVWTIEINAGFIGALNMIAHTKPSYQDKFDFFADCTRHISIPHITIDQPAIEGTLQLSSTSELYMKTAQLDVGQHNEALDILDQLVSEGITYLNDYIGTRALWFLSSYFGSEDESADTTAKIRTYIDELLRVDPTYIGTMSFIAIYSHELSYPNAEELLLQFKEKDSKNGTENLLTYYFMTSQEEKLFSLLKDTKDSSPEFLRKLGHQYVKASKEGWAKSDPHLKSVDTDILETAVAELLAQTEQYTGDVNTSILYITAIKDITTRRCCIRLAWNYYKSLDNYTYMLIFAKAFPSVCTDSSYAYLSNWLAKHKAEDVEAKVIEYIDFLGKNTSSRGNKHLIRSAWRAKTKQTNIATIT